MGSCQVTLLTTNFKNNNRQYESRLLDKVKYMDDLTRLTDREMMMYWNIKFRNSVYSSHLGFDSDGDGIINADDIWRYRYGPFVDSNKNGIVDMFDWQIDGFNSSYINNYPYRIHERWLGLELNPFWFREYTNRYTNYFRIHKKYRHHETKYIRTHTVRDNKRRAIYNTRIRNNTNKRATTRTIQRRRVIPIIRQSTRNTQTRRAPIKKYIKPATTAKRIPIRRVKTRATKTRKPSQVKRITSKRQITKKRN